jgi:hypothetical protein
MPLLLQAAISAFVPDPFGEALQHGLRKNRRGH